MHNKDILKCEILRISQAKTTFSKLFFKGTLFLYSYWLKSGGCSNNNVFRFRFFVKIGRAQKIIPQGRTMISTSKLMMMLKIILFILLWITFSDLLLGYLNSS